MNPALMADPELGIIGVAVHDRFEPRTLDYRGREGEHLFMLFHGAAQITFGERTFAAKPNTFCIWVPGIQRRFGNAEQPFSVSQLACRGKLVERSVVSEGLPLMQPFALPTASRFETQLGQLYDELVSYRQPNPEILCNTFRNLVIDLGRSLDASGTHGRIPPRWAGIRQFIGAKLRKRLPLKRLARKTGVSVPHFCAQFRKYFGVPPGEYIILLRMQHAAHLLRDEGYNVTEAGRAVGYEDPFYFSKVFKKHHGISPRAFRKAAPG